MSAEEVAKAFTAHYFSTFDSNASGLAGLFVSLIYPVRSVAGSCRQYLALLFHKAEAKLSNKDPLWTGSVCSIPTTSTP